MQKILATLNIIFAAFLFSSFVYLIVGFTLSQSHWKPVIADAGIRATIFWLFLVISMLLAFVALKLKTGTTKDDAGMTADTEQRQKYLLSRYVLLFAVAEAPAILGLVYLMLSGNFLREVILCAVSICTFLLVRPVVE